MTTTNTHTFNDSAGKRCRVKSHGDLLLFGCAYVRPYTRETVESLVHLDREQVEELVEVLQKWLQTGRI